MCTSPIAIEACKSFARARAIVALALA